MQEAETLPENDRVRYTISPNTQKEVLRCLLALNHQLAVAQTTAVPVQKKHGKKGKTKAGNGTPDLVHASGLTVNSASPHLWR